MVNVRYAQTSIMYSSLSSEFGLELAMRKLNMTEDQLAEKLGRYSRGPRKGKIKGTLTWEKVIQAGWVSSSKRYSSDDQKPSSGFVCRFVGLTFGYRVVDGWNGEELLAAGEDLASACKAKEAAIRTK